MALFKVFHLPDDEDKSFLLKPRARFDQSIADTYCITREQLNKVEDEKLSKEETVEQYMSAMAKASEVIWGLERYIHVADVRAKDIVQVLRNTNNINGHWFLTKAKGVEVVSNETERETCGGDVIEDVGSGERYMVYGYTFLNIKTGQLVK